MNLKKEIQKFFKGEISSDEATLKKYSRDASLFEVQPQLVVFPKDSEDLKNLVKWAKKNPKHTVTVRAGGSDMTGGPLSESIVADVSRHLNKIGEIGDNSVIVEPGAFYRDLEAKTLERNFILPCYPASKKLCALGGMFGNNCGGEKTLQYGKMEDFVLESKVIFSDGEEYIVKPLSKEELEVKITQNDFEGEIYRNLFNLLENNRKIIKEARPNVSKNSAGYYLWNIDKDSTFDLNKILVGSQGTLGIVTEMKIRLVEEKKHHDMISLFFKSWDKLPPVINAVLPYKPESLETFDEDTLKLGLRFMPEIARRAKTNLLSFALKFIPEALIGVKMFGLPKLIVLVEVAESNEDQVKTKVAKIVKALEPFDIWYRVIEKDSEEEKFWIMRRESFNLLREHSGEKRTAPFIEDFCLSPDKIPEFLPKALQILKKFNIKANIAGHAGNGNFHIIPLMDLKKKSERNKITVAADQFYNLVGEYKGSITAEHNDGIMRTPYLDKMYSSEVLALFKKTKEIFDPQNIFNPGKKVAGTLEYLEKHIATE